MIRWLGRRFIPMFTETDKDQSSWFKFDSSLNLFYKVWNDTKLLQKRSGNQSAASHSHRRRCHHANGQIKSRTQFSSEDRPETPDTDAGDSGDVQSHQRHPGVNDYSRSIIIDYWSLTNWNPPVHTLTPGDPRWASTLVSWFIVVAAGLFSPEMKLCLSQ